MFTVRSTVRIVRMAFLCYYLLSGVSQSPCIQMKHQTQHHEVRHISRIQTSVIYRLCSYKPRKDMRVWRCFAQDETFYSSSSVKILE